MYQVPATLYKHTVELVYWYQKAKPACTPSRIPSGPNPGNNHSNRNQDNSPNAFMGTTAVSRVIWLTKRVFSSHAHAP